MCINLLLISALILKVTTSHYTGQEIWKDDNFRDSETFGIAGGKNVSIDKVRYIAAAYFRNTPLGAAVLINKRWVVTAAFNVASTEGAVGDGLKYRFGSNFNDRGGVVIEPAKAFVHPNYTGNWDYDIALVKLKSNLKFSKNIRSIQIASSLPKNGTRVLVTGFGGDRETYYGYLRKATVTYIDYKACKNFYHRASTVTEDSFCTFDSDAGPCSYDWGSPLVYKNKLIGIYSGAFDCASTTFPPVYLDVTKFRKWIESTIKNN